MYNRIDMGVRIAGEKAIKDDEFVTKGQLVPGHGVTLITDGGDVVINNTGSAGIPIQNVIIYRLNWVMVTNNLWYYSYANVHITDKSVVTIIPKNEYRDIVVNAQILPHTTSFHHAVRLYTRVLPADDFIVDMYIGGLSETTGITEVITDNTLLGQGTTSDPLGVNLEVVGTAGSKNVDGGRPNSVYLPSQRVDGGRP